MALTCEQVAAAYAQFGHLVLRRCRAILRQEDEALDATQEAFLRLMRYGNAYQTAASPLRWLYRVADRVCFDLLRARQRRPEPSDQVEQETATPGSLSQMVADRELVIKFLDRFDDRHKELLLMYHLEGLSQEDIASQLGWSRQTVNKKLSRLQARAMSLQAKLEGE